MAESTRPSIEWVDAEREHLDEIQHFTCTSPIPRGPGGRRLEHPKRYELTAQSVIRNCKPPVHEPHVLLLGLIEGEIATVASFTYLLNSSQQAPIVFINAIGLSTTFRGGDGSMADETLQRVLIRTGSDLSGKGLRRGDGARKHSQAEPPQPSPRGANQLPSRRSCRRRVATVDMSVQLVDLRGGDLRLADPGGLP